MARVWFGFSGCALALLLGCGETTARAGAAGGTSSGGGSLSSGGTLTSSGGTTESAAGSAAGGSGGRSIKPTGGTSGSGASSGAGGAGCKPYLSCPCGCCPGTTTSTPTDCEYPEYAAPPDDGTGARSSGGDCSQGCSFGRLYACCVSAPIGDANDSEYSATYTPDFGGRIDVLKKDPAGNCTRFELVPGTNTLPSLSSAWLRWNGQGQYGACGDTSSPLSVIGIEGIVETLPIEEGCQLSVHVTLFVGAPELAVIAVPVHAELSQPVLPADLCPGI